jgi:hypothetical protein
VGSTCRMFQGDVREDYYFRNGEDGDIILKWIT